MLTCVMGFPVARCIGLPLMSTVDLEAAADVLSALGAAMLAALYACDCSAFFDGAAFTGRSWEVVL